MTQQPTPFEALQLAIDQSGGQAALARACGVSQAAVWKWVQSAKRVSPIHAIAVERATGVSRHLLRPDIYPLETVQLPASAIGEEIPLCGPVISARAMAQYGNRGAVLDAEKAA